MKNLAGLSDKIRELHIKEQLSRPSASKVDEPESVYTDTAPTNKPIKLYFGGPKPSPIVRVLTTSGVKKEWAEDGYQKIPDETSDSYDQAPNNKQNKRRKK